MGGPGSGNIKSLKNFTKNDPRRINKPKGATSVVADLRRFMDQKLYMNDPVTGERKKIRMSQMVAMSLIKSANKGSVPAIQEIMDRIDGKVAQLNVNLNSTTDDKKFRDEFFGLKTETGDTEDD